MERKNKARLKNEEQPPDDQFGINVLFGVFMILMLTFHEAVRNQPENDFIVVVTFMMSIFIVLFSYLLPLMDAVKVLSASHRRHGNVRRMKNCKNLLMLIHVFAIVICLIANIFDCMTKSVSRGGLSAVVGIGFLFRVAQKLTNYLHKEEDQAYKIALPFLAVFGICVAIAAEHVHGEERNFVSPSFIVSCIILVVTSLIFGGIPERAGREEELEIIPGVIAYLVTAIAFTGSIKFKYYNFLGTITQIVKDAFEVTV